MVMLDILAALAVGGGSVIALKLFVLWRFHRRGMPLPGESRENYLAYSPRFEDNGDGTYHDSWTGLEVRP